MVSASESEGPGVAVWQQNTNYSSWSNSSPTHYGTINGNTNMYPFSMCICDALISTMADTSNIMPNNINVYVSDERITQKDTVVYLAVYNAYAIFKGSSVMSTYFQWDDSIPGYKLRADASSSYGPLAVTSLTVTKGSTVSVAIKRGTAGTTNGASGTATLLTNGTPGVKTPRPSGYGDTYEEMYWKAANNSCYLLKFECTTDNELYNQITFTLDSGEISKVKVGSSPPSDAYLVSGVFVPIAYVVNTAGLDDQMLADLDEIVQLITDLNTNVVDGFETVTQTVTDGFQDILDKIGSGNIQDAGTILYYLNRMHGYLFDIASGIAHQPNGPGQLSTAVQYIDYYCSQIYSNTDTMVQYLADITSTLSSIAQQISDTNDAIDDLNADQDDIHQAEQDLYDDANQAIGNTVISSFAFDGYTGQGVARAGLDFTALWTALGAYNQVYNFALIMTLALTIIRYTTRRPKGQGSKQGKKDGGNTG